MHKYARHKTNLAWDTYIHSLCHAKKPKSPLAKAKLTLIRHAHRTLDYDGLVGSMKPVVDALVTCGILKDDSWNVLGKWNVDQAYRPEAVGPLLEVLVYEC